MPGRLSVLLAVVVCLALPSSAHAFTASKVIAPGDGFYSVAGAGGTVDIEVDVEDPASGDKADLVCIVLRNSFRVLFDAADASGDFAKTIDIDDLRAGTCLIVAVPDGTDIANDDLSRFTGPIITTDWRETYRSPSGDASGNVVWDFFHAQQQPGGYGDYNSISSCGICDTSLRYADTRRPSEYMFWGNAQLGTREPSPRMRSHLRIDGRNAYGAFAGGMELDPSGRGSMLEGAPSAEVTATGSRDEDLVVDEAEDLVRCQNGDTMPVTALGCGRFVGTGVRLQRRIRQTRAGTLIHVVDVFSSVDGREHELDLHWSNKLRDPPGSAEPSLQFPWVSDAYDVPSQGDEKPAPPGAPFTFFARANHSAADGERPWPQGAIVMDTPASGPLELFGDTHLVVPMRVTVPAGGAATVRQAFVTAPTRAEAAEVAAAVEAGYAPPADPGPPPPQNPLAPPVDRTAPVLSRVSLAARRFRAAKGTRVRLRLSEPARVRLAIARRLPGRRARLKRLGTVSRRARAGANRLRFTGRLKGRALRPGTYRMVVDAVDAAKNRSRARTLRFRIVRR